MKKYLLLTILLISCLSQIRANEVCIDSLANNYFPVADPNNSLYNPAVAAIVTVNPAICEYSEGCTDPLAFNFDSEAVIDDGSCVDVVVGCPDSNYLEYSSEVNVDDGSCITPKIYGCMDHNYIEYSQEANTDTDPSSCLNEIELGCTDLNYLEYNPLANTSDASMCVTEVLLGCTDPLYLEYNALANTDDSSCLILVIEGCLDTNYLEYDETANVPDSSQCVNEILAGCMDNSYVDFNPLANQEDQDACITLIVYGCTDSSYLEYSVTANTNDQTQCITIIVEGCINPQYLEYDFEANTDDGSCLTIAVSGCMDSNYLEFDENANIFNSSMCITELISGCTDLDALNFNTSANIDDGSCDYEIFGCTDSQALNYNPDATIDNGSCDYNQSNCVLPEEWSGNTGANMTVFLYQDAFTSLPELVEGAYVVAVTNSGLVVGSENVFGLYQPSIAVWGDDSETPEVDGALTGELINYYLVNGGALYTLEFSWYVADGTSYVTNSVNVANAVSLDDACSLIGCTDTNACNYSPSAGEDNGSCEYPEEYYNCDGDCLLDTDGDGVCDELEVLGCAQPNYLEYWNYTIVSVEGVDYYYVETPINEWVDDDGVSCQTELVVGCVYDNYIEYNPMANVFDVNLCQTIIVYGCTDETAFNYSYIGNTDDGSCYPVIEGCMDQIAFNYVQPTGDVFIDINTSNQEMCIPVIYGCLDPDAYNFNDYDSDGEYNELTGILGIDVNTDDGSCIELVYGCLDNDYIEYNDLANTDDGSCQMLLRVAFNELTESHQELSESYEELNSASSVAVSELQLIIESWNTTIDLEEGWNMFGYGCPDAIDLNSVLDSYIDIEIVKDNNGLVYWPEFGFNGIGDFTPGFGYQIKVTEALEGFSLCDWYVNDIPEDNIVSLQEENDFLQAELDSIYGCIDVTACNYDVTSLLSDGSCEYAQEGYDCNGFEITSYEIGDYAQGGIVFYVDSTGQHGLVLSNTEFGNMSWYDAMLFADTTNYLGYNDWFIPSTSQCDLIYDNIGNGSFNNLLDLQHVFYWTSETYPISDPQATQAQDYSFEVGNWDSPVQMTNDGFYVIIIRFF